MQLYNNLNIDELQLQYAHMNTRVIVSMLSSWHRLHASPGNV